MTMATRNAARAAPTTAVALAACLVAGAVRGGGAVYPPVGVFNSSLFAYTVAGSSAPSSGRVPDGTPATAAAINPSCIHLAGDVMYMCDKYASVIYSVSMTTGSVTGIAGNGTSGYSTGGGVATAAMLYSPFDVAWTGSALVIADSNNCCIRSVTAGIITTIAGTCGVQGEPNVGALATSTRLKQTKAVVHTNSTLYLSSTSGVYYIDSGGRLQVACVSTSVTRVDGIVITPAGSVLLADALAKRVWRVTSTTTVAAYAGSGQTTPSSTIGVVATTASMNYPWKLAYDATHGIVYVTDLNAGLVYAIDTATGLLWLAAGTSNGSRSDCGPGTDILLRQAAGVAVDPARGLYVGNVVDDVTLNYNPTVIPVCPSVASSPLPSPSVASGTPSPSLSSMSTASRTPATSVSLGASPSPTWSCLPTPTASTTGYAPPPQTPSPTTSGGNSSVPTVGGGVRAPTDSPDVVVAGAVLGGGLLLGIITATLARRAPGRRVMSPAAAVRRLSTLTTRVGTSGSALSNDDVANWDDALAALPPLSPAHAAAVDAIAACCSSGDARPRDALAALYNPAAPPRVPPVALDVLWATLVPSHGGVKAAAPPTLAATLALYNAGANGHHRKGGDVATVASRVKVQLTLAPGGGPGGAGSGTKGATAVPLPGLPGPHLLAAALQAAVHVATLVTIITDPDGFAGGAGDGDTEAAGVTWSTAAEAACRAVLRRGSQVLMAVCGSPPGAAQSIPVAGMPTALAVAASEVLADALPPALYTAPVAAALGDATLWPPGSEPLRTAVRAQYGIRMLAADANGGDASAAVIAASTAAADDGGKGGARKAFPPRFASAAPPMTLASMGGGGSRGATPAPASPANGSSRAANPAPAVWGVAVAVAWSLGRLLSTP